MAAEVKEYAVATLVAATKNFTRGYIGNGAFGKVFSAKLDGKNVAIKRMETAHRRHELQRERLRDAKLRHDCLLPCLGMVRARSRTLHARLPRAPAPCQHRLCAGQPYSRLDALRRARRAQRRSRGLTRAGTSQADDDLHSYLVYPRMHCDLDKALLTVDLSADQLLQIALDCAKGLQALVAFDLCHRDLKPPNVLLNENFHAVLADFGTLCLIPECVAQRAPARLQRADAAMRVQQRHACGYTWRGRDAGFP